MTKSNQERSGDFRKKKPTTQERLLAVFAAVIPRMGSVLDACSLSKEERRACIYSQNQLHRIVARMRTATRPTVNISEFLDMRSPDYSKQVEVFHAMDARTLVRFLNMPLPALRIRFAENGLTLPVVFDLLHSEYNREKSSVPGTGTKRKETA